MREGVCAVWMFVAPPGGWRTGDATATGTQVDWAHPVRRVVDDPRFAAAERITLVCDHRNTHSPASLSAAIESAEALRQAGKLDLVHRPKHGSWRNVVESEPSVLTPQCLGRPIPDRQTAAQQATVRAVQHNALQIGVDWHFTTDDARIRLKRRSPKLAA